MFKITYILLFLFEHEQEEEEDSTGELWSLRKIKEKEVKKSYKVSIYKKIIIII